MNEKKTHTLSKKEARKQIASKLEKGLSELKTALGEKEFESRLKKAVRIFAKGFKGEAPKTAAATAAPEAKAAAKTAAAPKAAKKAPTPKKAQAPKKAAAKKK